jgi:chorismate synthase
MRFLTAGESHGPGLIGIFEGLPSGIPVNLEVINRALAARQQGPGRGERMKIERDRALILGGVVGGETYGGPLCLQIKNRDDRNLPDGSGEPQTIPRPGHADLAGSIKYGLTDLKIPAERASARLSAIYVAFGALMKDMLSDFGIKITGYVQSIGGIMADGPDESFEAIEQCIEASSLRCPDLKAAEAMHRLIEECADRGDSLGGRIRVVAEGVPPGLGSFVHWDRKLDGRLAAMVMSIPAIKGVEIGDGFALDHVMGSSAHDALFREERLVRRTNRAGGIEGGVSNGERIVVTAAMKPIPTLRQGLPSVDVSTGENVKTCYVRSDVCAVPAASIVAEAVVSLCLGEVFIERFGGDTLEAVKESFRLHNENLVKYK